LNPFRDVIHKSIFKEVTFGANLNPSIYGIFTIITFNFPPRYMVEMLMRAGSMLTAIAIYNGEANLIVGKADIPNSKNGGG